MRFSIIRRRPVSPSGNRRRSHRVVPRGTCRAVVSGRVYAAAHGPRTLRTSRGFRFRSVGAPCPYILMDYGEVVFLYRAVVSLFRGDRASGRAGACGRQYRKERFDAVFRDSKFFRHHCRRAGRQSYGGRTPMRGDARLPSGRNAGLCDRYPAGACGIRVFGKCFEALHRRHGGYRDSVLSVLRDAFDLRDFRTRLRVLQRCHRDR